MLRWIDAALEDLSGKSVLEIGSATPRDANYIRSHGMKVQTSDATSSLVEYLRTKGENALHLNILTDPLPEGYDLIFANAVAPHFTKKDILNFFDKLNRTLPVNARVAFNLKMGDSEEWINEKLHTRRFIHYWQPSDIETILKRYDFNVIFFETNASGDFPNHHWINIVLEKKQTSKGLSGLWKEDIQTLPYLRPLLDLARSVKR
jgi:hypothetical protein